MKHLSLLLLLLVMGVGSVWGDTTLLTYTTTSTAPTAKTDITAGSGKIQAGNAFSVDGTTVSGSYGWKLDGDPTSSKATSKYVYLKLASGTTFAAGDVITLNGFSGSSASESSPQGFSLYDSAGGSTLTQYGHATNNSTNKNTLFSIEYTIPLGSALIGKSEVYVSRYFPSTESSGKSASFTGVTITRSGSTPALSSIAVKTAPTKTTYTTGETFDPTGLVITKTMSDGSTADVLYASESSNFTFNPTTSTALTTGNNSVTITYGGKTTSQAITVNPSAVSSLTAISSAKTWTFTTAGGWSSASASSTAAISDNLEYKNVSTDGSKLYFSGSGSTSDKYVHFKLAVGSYKVTANFNNTTSGRTLKINIGGTVKDLGSTTGTSSGIDGSQTFTCDSETDIYVYSGNSGINLYYLKIEESAPVAGPTANFTYGSTSWTTPGTNDMTITIPAHKGGQSFDVTLSNITDGAEVNCTANGTYNNGTLSITAPTSTTSAVAKQTTIVTVTKSGVTATYNIAVTTEAKTGITFNESTRYSKLVINANIGSFYGNTALKGFNTYNASGTKQTTASWKKSNGDATSMSIDYVAGLVAKGIIEAADYYSITDPENAKAWYYSIADYANTVTVPTGGGSLDDLNASKMFCTLYDLTKTGGAFNSLTGANTVNSNANDKMGNALTGLSAHNSTYSFGATNYTSNTSIGSTDLTGGWFHKSSYEYQMWGDGAYMGPALLAQLNNCGHKINESGDWDLITKQFRLPWGQMWNSSDKLLYHAFTSKRDVSSYTATWAGNADRTQTLAQADVYHSASYWGRACGWYFLALVDALEQMQKAGIASTNANYSELQGYLSSLAAGLKDRQDATTGCWYQLLNQNGTFSATDCGNNSTSTRVYNYLESSATAIYAAAYLKAIRLGLLDKATYESTAKAAYEGIIKNFMTSDYKLYWTCRSAGLGGGTDKKLRDGSPAYYLKGHDVYPTKVTDDGTSKDETGQTTLYNGTEGKTLGAFIMAATEYERAYLDAPVEATITLKAVTSDGTVLNESISTTTGTVGEAKTVYYPKYVLYQGTLYEVTANASGAKYGKSVTPNTASYSENITYTATDITSVAYYYEGENITGYTASDGSYIPNNCSNGLAARSGGSAKTIGNLTSGVYKIYASAYGDNGTRNSSFKVGDTEVWNFGTSTAGVHNENSDNFTVNNTSALTVATSATSTAGLDYFYVQRVGDVPGTTFTTPWNNVETERKALATGKTMRIQFHNTSNTTRDANYDNWILAAGTSTAKNTDYMALRADAYDIYNNGNSSTRAITLNNGTINWDTFRADMQAGADVDIYVTNTGNKLYVNATSTNGSNTYVLTAETQQSGETAYISLMGEYCTLSDITFSDPVDAYSFTGNAGTNGTPISLKNGNGMAVTSGTYVQSGEKLIYTVAPNTGYTLNGWNYTGTEGQASTDGAYNVYTINSIGASTTATAQWKAVPVGGTTIGNEDNTTGEWGARSTDYDIAQGQTYKFNFKNYGNGDATWNFIFAAQDASSKTYSRDGSYLALYNNAWWSAGSLFGSGWTTSYKSNNCDTKMQNGAPVEVLVTYNEDGTISYEATAWDPEDSETQIMHFTKVTEATSTVSTADPQVNATAINVYFTVAKAHLTDFVATPLYNITYDMNGHGTQIDPETKVSALPATLPTPTVEGYDFGGWYTDNGLTSVAIAGATLSGNTTLYAKWTATAASVASIKTTSGEGTSKVTTWNFSAVTKDHAKTLTGWTSGDSYYKSPTYSEATYLAPTWCYGIEFGVRSAETQGGKLQLNFSGSNKGIYFNGNAASMKIDIPAEANTLVITTSNNDIPLVSGTNGVTFTKDAENNTFTAFVTPGTTVEIHRSSSPGGVITKVEAKYTLATVTATNDGNGSATASSTSVAPGGTSTFTATPNTGYKFVNWTDNNNADAVVSTANPYTATIEGNTSLKANFVAQSSATAPTVTGGTIDGTTITATAVASFNAGTSQTITLTLPEGASIKSVTGGTGNNGVITYTAPAAGQNGTITVVITAENGTDVTYTINTSTESSTESKTLYSTTAIAILSVDASASNVEVGSANATTAGGSLYAYNGKTSAQALVDANCFRLSSNNTYFRVQTDYAIKAGDVIEAKVRQDDSATGRGIVLSTSTSYTTTGDVKLLTTETGSGTYQTIQYIVQADDELVGKNVFYIYRATGNNTMFQDFKITGVEAQQIASDLTATPTEVTVYVNTTTTPVDITSSSDGEIKAVSSNSKITVSVVDNQLQIVTTSATATGITVTISQDATTAYAAGEKKVTVNVVKPDMAAPVINYANQTVTITSEVEDADISYCTSTNGTDWGEWMTYTAPFTITETTYVKAKATADNYKDSPESAIKECDYEVQYYNYSVVCVAKSGGTTLKTLATGTAEAGSNITVAFPRFILDGTTLREARQIDDNKKQYNATFSITENNQVCQIVYNKGSVSNVIYYAEAEDLDGFTKSTGGNANIRASQSAVGYSNGDVNIMDLVPGNYYIHAFATNGNSSAMTSSFKVGAEEKLGMSYSLNNWATATSSRIDVLEKSALTVSSTGGLDCFYITQDDVLTVTSDGQKFAFTVENVDNTFFTTTNATTKTAELTRDDVTGSFYMVKYSSNYMTIKETGALSFEIKAFHTNPDATRTAKVYVDGVLSTTMSITPGDATSSGLISFGDKDTHTIKIEGTGSDIYPADIIFYTAAMPATLMPTSAAVKALATTTVNISSKATTNSSNITINETSVTNAADIVTASYSAGVLTLTGKKEGTATLTFNITSDNTDIFTNGTDIAFDVTVTKNELKMVYVKTGSKNTEYSQFTHDFGESATMSFTAPFLKLYTLNPDSADVADNNKPNITYTSTDNTIATVDGSGNISIENDATGTAIITATSAETDALYSAKAQFLVTIIRGRSWKINNSNYTYDDATQSTEATKATTVPIVGKKFIVTDGKSEPSTYITATFGGWQWASNAYKYPKSATETSDKTDAWQSSTQSAAVDGYTDYVHGTQDASNEDMYGSDDLIYGVKRYGWFKVPDADGTKYPFTLPCRGSYMTFEPTVNGKLTIYINQNGAWNVEKDDVTDNDGNKISRKYDEDHDYSSVKFPGNCPFQFRPHAFYIVDQEGVPVDSYTDFTIVTNTVAKQGITDGKALESKISSESDTKKKAAYQAQLALLNKFCDTYGVKKGEKFKCILDPNADGYYDVTNIGNWTEFKQYMSKGEQQRVCENWSSGVNGAQKVTKLDNGAYLMVDEGMTKYTFYVAAGQTYYIFSNFSKLGFAGCNFVPDENENNQPTKDLSLSETVAFENPTLDAAKNTTSANTNHVGYISVPQYKTIKLTRSFTADKWNTICLPFTMTEKEVRENFGDGTQLLVMDRVEAPSDGKITIHFTYHEIQSLLAGYPYLILPKNTISSITVNNKCIESNRKLQTYTSNGYTCTGIEGFCTADVSNGSASNYSKKLEVGDIFLSGGKMYLSKGTTYLKGYRAYISAPSASSSQAAKSATFTYSMPFRGDGDDDVTEISVAEMDPEVLETFGIPVGVYNLNGQKVSDSLTGLPRGIYIVNGKKMYVK